MRFRWYRAPNLWLSGIGMIISLVDLALLLGWGIKPNLFGIDLIWFGIGFTVASLPFTAFQIFRRPAPPHRFPEPLEFALAQAKARALLDSFLTDKQRYDLEHFGFFTHYGKKHYYNIKRGWSMNITAFRRSEFVPLPFVPSQPELICAYPYSEGVVMPPEDVMLAQLLWLRNDEKGFRRKANILR